ncbi:MAG: chemotaxis protein CheW [Thalassobium sp.]|uniref:Chemotaxis protein CheW n=1 Tax=Thalassolituus pacificus TaxID=2975440 RepID=A0A9X2WBT9_9GAMM|nr:chemotaxis protein CheW [Thalassolituus pacificus]MCT7357464.1 chemotaxis protein CheW [Thalassolituus pacificus]PHS63208.1 MAG: chemotaxis protein CheW [Thalassobium sp.]
MDAVATAVKNESGSTDEQQYLTFMMSDEEYGVDILAVQEIRGWEESTLIPNAPEYIRGVINLRGTIVPIMDLRIRFGLKRVEYSPVTVVIILKVDGDHGERVMGIVVDAVSDVYTISDASTRKPPELTEDRNSGFIKGLVNVNEKMVILLDVDDLLNISEDQHHSGVIDN